MGAEIQKNSTAVNFQNNCLSSIETSAKNAEEQKDAKQVEFDKANAQYNIFRQNKTNAYKKLQSLKTQYKDTNNYNVRDAQSAYASACCSLNGIESTTSALSMTLMDSIFYSGKMSSEAIIARSSVNA